ncbi:phosphopantetheine-binding protein [Herbidospora cretacea]|uniref:phosphopantetheine-binding protein n=1 Tax=Herbidospora cretacea TaxID=28444 RepID=UPI0004C3F4DD|nr:phosphopantetheine-binding protein [Herbidospora cretacea]
MPKSRELERTQVLLREIWIDLLEYEEVDTEDNFFDLGGDSLQAVEMVFRAREVGISMEVRDLFATDTLADLADTVCTA